MKSIAQINREINKVEIEAEKKLQYKTALETLKGIIKGNSLNADPEECFPAFSTEERLIEEQRAYDFVLSEESTINQAIPQVLRA